MPYIENFKYDECLACGRRKLVNTTPKDLTEVKRDITINEDTSEQSREMREYSFEYMVAMNEPRGGDE